MREYVETALNYSPSHRAMLSQAIAGMDPEKELERIAAMLGRTAKHIGLVEIPNPFNAKDEPVQRDAWNKWFKAGFERGEVPPPKGQPVNSTEEVSFLRSQLAAANGIIDEIQALNGRVNKQLSEMTKAHDIVVAQAAEAEKKLTAAVTEANEARQALITATEQHKARVAELEADDEVLNGSGVLPAMLAIGDKEIQLGKLVTEAHARSRMKVRAWNGLADDQREALLLQELRVMRAVAGRDEHNMPLEPKTGDAANAG